MNPLTQKFTIAEHGHGDCWRTAFACVLGKTDPEEVPDFGFDPETKECRDSWWDETCDWLRTQGYEMVGVGLGPRPEGHEIPEDVRLRLMTETYVVDGLSPRVRPDGGKIYHACVGHKLEVIHDPHPERLGLVGRPYAAYLLTPITT